ncbi:MAG TPA: nitroreductase family deazaflavin-dependent oxidoreductase [Ktedonobacterales bacterium]|nr:nitroreductase family deazaflavin-dependent oxidoreductase [Ktedonobacterales bacterium]
MRNQLATHLGNRMVRFVDLATQRLYRLTDGRIGHRQLGWTFLLLTTTGRKTGRPRVHALLYLPDGDDLVIVASNNGGDAHPAWYLNLCAQPRVFVQAGRRKGAYRARTASPDERRDLWPRLVAYNPPYRHHQEQTQREIPVVILSPVTDETPT